MKPNFSATATGSRVNALLQFEDDVGGTEGDGVPALERLGTLNPAAVDLDAVGRAEVAHGPGRPGGSHLGVLARDVGVVDLDVGLAGAAEHGAAGADHRRAPVDAHPGG